MHLHEVFGWEGPMTYRQYLVWQEWLLMELERPSRTDYYIMQNTFHLIRANVKNPGSVKMEEMKLRFKRVKVDIKAAGSKLPDPSTPEGQRLRQEAADRSKATWLGGFARAGVRVRKESDVNVPSPNQELDPSS